MPEIDSVAVYTDELCQLFEEEVGRVRAVYEQHKNYFEWISKWLSTFDELIQTEVLYPIFLIPFPACCMKLPSVKFFYSESKNGETRQPFQIASYFS